MFDRFNDTARRVIVLAGDEARALGHEGIGTAHLLLALTAATTADGQPSTAAVAITAVGVEPSALRDLTLAGLPVRGRHEGGYLPFSPEVKRALEAAASAADTLGDNHIKPEHLLAGLAENTESAAAKAISGVGMTYGSILAAIKQSIPAPTPTAARSFNVFLATDLPAGTGPKLYPDPSSAKTAFPDQEITAFRVDLHEGEFFEVCSLRPEYEIWGSFSSYGDAFTVAEALTEAGRPAVTTRIMVPRIKEIRGKDSRGHDVVLGKTIDYTTARIITRITGATTILEEEVTHV